MDSNNHLPRFCWICPTDDPHETLPNDYLCAAHRDEFNRTYGVDARRIAEIDKEANGEQPTQRSDQQRHAEA